MISPELQSKLFLWRQKSDNGTITLEEMREAVKELRAGRLTAGMAAKTTGSRKAKGPTQSADAMLSELEGL
jgi:hypothetical protein